MKKITENDFYIRVEKDDSKILINSIYQDDMEHLNRNIKILFIHENKMVYSIEYNFINPTSTYWVIPFQGYSNELYDITLSFFSENEHLFNFILDKNYNNHFYQKIDGWFDYKNVYSDIVKNAQNGSKFVEIGAWLGRSTSFMANEIKQSGKNIKFYVVDTWEGSNEIYHENFKKNYGSVYKHFIENTSSLKDYIMPIISLSYEAPRYFDDLSLDFVYIDADHSYDIVKKDIISWYPKVKYGGIIAGHDYYNCKQVQMAVEDTIGRDLYFDRLTWLYKKVKNEI